ncbi:hypothetical protein HPB47_012364 [Ixodes persulcatus]|uniref:Uncharacterized protein n=1 Tax=Ixodes persulcatus TaxID=34615 RepID=A0AC60NTZ0_IXOPE|nr:hypothetical protein HPB47_012364 [Ixodes persulcatus]
MHEGCREPTDGDSAEAMGRLASGCASSIRLGRLLGCRQDALALFVTLLTGPLSPCAGERHCFRRRKRRKNASSPVAKPLVRATLRETNSVVLMVYSSAEARGSGICLRAGFSSAYLSAPFGENTDRLLAAEPEWGNRVGERRRPSIGEPPGGA